MSTRTEYTLYGLFLNCVGLTLLVPSRLIAEVVHAPTIYPYPTSNAPGVLGAITWQAQEVPVVSFEELAGVACTLAQDDARYIAIFRATVATYATKFIAIPIQDVPHQQKISAGDLVVLARDREGLIEHVVVSSATVAIIPNLIYLTHHVANIWSWPNAT